MFFASALIFFALEVIPGDAAQILGGADASPETIEALTNELGLNRPVLTRYFDWIIGIFDGNLGHSYVYGTSVSALILERLQVTLPLAIMAMVFTLLMALPAGVYAALHQGKFRDHLISTVTEIGIAIPNFWLAILLILFFVVTLQWFPFGGFAGWNAKEGGGVFSAMHTLLLPAFALAIVQAAVLTRFVRSSVLDIMHEKFVQVVQAKGVSKHLILWQHVLKNASIPILTLIGLQFSTLLAGAVVTENVFILPGLGRLIKISIENRDLIVIRNVVLLLVCTVMSVNMLIDCLCMQLDPRFAQSQYGEH